MTCRAELTMQAILAAYAAQMVTTFGAGTSVVRELPPENTANITAAVTGFMCELDGTTPNLADNSGKVISKRAPILMICLLKCGQGEESTLYTKAREFEAAMETLAITPITADGAAVKLRISGSYGRAVGKNQLWVDIPFDVLTR